MDTPYSHLAQSRVFRWIVCPLLLALSLFWLLLAFRWVSLFLLVLVVALRLFLPWHSRGRRLAVVWALFVVSTFLPVDISFQETPGPPRFVRLVYGLPGPELVEEAAMGHVVLGGCVVDGLEPKWVLVWRHRPGGVPYDHISERRLHRLALPLLEYMEDNKDTLPPLSDLKTARQALSCYIVGDGPAMFVQPQTGESYQPNAALSNQSLDRIAAPDKTPVFYEAHSAPDGTRRFLTLDGQVHSVPESQWPQWKQEAQLP